MNQAQKKVIQDAIALKIEKLADLQREETITANAEVKFEMKKRISELEKEINDLEKKLQKADKQEAEKDSEKSERLIHAKNYFENIQNIENLNLD